MRQIDSPAHMLELYYWSREHRLLHIIRTIVAMPPASRSAIEAFFEMTAPDSISAVLDCSGRLIITSSDATQLIMHMQQVLAVEGSQLH